MHKLVKALIGAAVGWVIDQAAAEALEAAGVPKGAATAAGAAIGALL